MGYRDPDGFDELDGPNDLYWSTRTREVICTPVTFRDGLRDNERAHILVPDLLTTFGARLEMVAELNRLAGSLERLMHKRKKLRGRKR